MKKHKDILDSQRRFVQRREKYLELNYKFYNNLVDKIGGKLEIPNGSFIKYKVGTNDNINIIEEWIELNDDESCSMQVGIIAGNINHKVSLATYKKENSLILKVSCADENKEFEYNISETQPENIEFENVVSFISESLVKNYDKWEF